ncbi:hypothetical protein V1514DRAFT_334156 [Lipomyces japonicus]|uniref:uncharacterized protein n=1 Tax=Lipomyces japonicus TaxID=56871 RepID=UPI0034CDB262
MSAGDDEVEPGAFATTKPPILTESFLPVSSEKSANNALGTLPYESSSYLPLSFGSLSHASNNNNKHVPAYTSSAMKSTIAGRRSYDLKTMSTSTYPPEVSEPNRSVAAPSSPVRLPSQHQSFESLREAVNAAQIMHSHQFREAPSDSSLHSDYGTATKYSRDQSPAKSSAYQMSSFTSVQTEFQSNYDNLDFPTPKLYDLSLQLNSDPGLEDFWRNLTQILETNYLAKRISLSLPNDLTDITNTPWGLKAVWTSKSLPWALSRLQHHRNSQIAECIERESNNANDSQNEDSSWEDMFDDTHEHVQKDTRPRSFRHRSESTITGDDADISDEENLNFLFRRQTEVGTGTTRVYSALRPLDSDIDPLIDNLGVNRVIQRGKIVLLQREYRSFDDGNANTSNDVDDDQIQHDSVSVSIDDRRRSVLSDGSGDRPALQHRNAFVDVKEKKRSFFKPKLRDPFEDNTSLVPPGTSNSLPYEDYEQALSSPWSHSPAPSPAISKDSQENPFFSNVNSVIDDAFASPEDLTPPLFGDISGPVRAIGLESSYSVIHIPLIHPSLSRFVGASASRQQKIVPIAIVSILSDIIPYPVNLIKSLFGFAPHMASSFSLADAHSNLKYQIEMTKKLHRHKSRHHHAGKPNGTTRRQSLSRSNSYSGGSYFSLHRLSDSEADLSEGASGWDSNAAIDQNSLTAKVSPAGTYFSAPSSGKVSPVVSPDVPISDSSVKRKSQHRLSGLFRSPPSPPPKSPISSFSSVTSTAPSTSSKTHYKRRSEDHGHMLPPSPHLLRTIIDSIPVHIYIASPKVGKISWVSARTLAYSGITPEQYCSEPVAQRFHPDDQEKFTKAWRNCLKNGEPLSLNLRIRRFDGIYRFFIVRAVPLRNSKGAIVHWFGTHVDNHEQRTAEYESIRQREKLASERKYKKLAESSPLIVFTATESAGITYVNTQWLKYSNRKLEDTLAFGFLESVYPEDRIKCTLPNSRKENRFSCEVRLKNAAGDYRWHLVRCVCADLEDDSASTVESESTDADNVGTAIDSEPGLVAAAAAAGGGGEEVNGTTWFGSCTDINDHKMVEEKLQEAKNTAQRTMESKTRFLSNMSHEIRTPLIGISGMVNFLMDTSLTTEQLDYCSTISSSSEALLSVINDILDLSKAEAGKMRLNKEWFHIRWLVEDANELLSTLAISKNLELNYIVEENVPAVVNGDRIRIRQVLLNIIGNAIKFTSKGEVFTRCSVKKQKGNTIVLHFECHDTGAGFAKEDEVLMFKPFSQIDGTMTRKHGGSGLGLVISRQLIELHGGTINCRGEKGKGSTFFFTAEFGLPTEEDQHVSSPPLLRTSTNKHLSTTPVISEEPGHGSSVRSGTSASAMPPAPFSLPSPVSESPISLSQQVNTASSVVPASATLADPRNMRFRIPSDPHSRYRAPLLEANSAEQKEVLKNFVFALIVCDYPFTTEAIVQHVKESLPVDTVFEYAHVTDYDSAAESLDVLAKKYSESQQGKPFTHVIINVADYSEIVGLTAKVLAEPACYGGTKVVAVTTPMQKSAIMQNIRITDPSGKIESIEQAQINISSESTGGKHFESASTPLTPLPNSDSIEDYRILEKHIETRFFCVSKPLKVSRLTPVFNPSRGSINTNSSISSTTSPTNEKLTSSSVDHRDQVPQDRKSKLSIFKQLKDAVGDQSYRVLLVEDNPVNQKVLHQFLSRGGLEVDTVADGEECTQKVYGSAPEYYDLIVCDLHMPRKDGFQTCAELRRWEEDNGIEKKCPIIALSANVMSDVAEKCASVGFSRYISKPINFTLFKDVIIELLASETA